MAGSLATTATETRKLAAIMFTDIVDFSRQMGSNEARMLRLLDVHNRIIEQVVIEHHGHVIKSTGDGFLVDFSSVVHAVQCAQAIQGQFRSHNAEKEQAEQIHIRIGIHLGDIVEKNGDVQGDGVNIAARLQPLAEPDTICISHVVYKEVEKKVDLGTVVSLGWPKLKNIAERFEVYALLPEPPKGVRQILQIRGLKFKHHRVALWGTTLALGIVLVSVGTPALKNLYAPAPLQQPQGTTLTNTTPLPLPDKPSIVILPFANMSNDPEQEYFSDGLTEDLTTDLSQLSGLFVIARNSAFTYKGKPVKIQEISRELGVQYVLEGSVRRADSQVRINAQLIDVTTGSHLWGERYDRPLQDIFTVQNEIVQKIVTTLKLQLMLQEQGYTVRKRTDNLEAYDYFLRGVAYFWRFTQQTNARARQMFEKAIELDPQYAEAYAWLGWTYHAERNFGWSADPQTMERELALAQQALALDDSLAGAHSLLSFGYVEKQQYDQAIAEGNRAIALDPNDAIIYAKQAQVLNLAGRPEEALQAIEKAMRLNPHYPPLNLLELGGAYRLMGRYEEAIAALKRAVIGNPDFLIPHFHLAIIYSELGREEEAQAEGAEILRISPTLSLAEARSRLPFKDPAEAERNLAALRKAGLK
jgi:adenylate cyclase